MPSYFQPIAQHRSYPDRLLLHGADGRCYVWLGDTPERTVEEIAGSTALWLQTNGWAESLDRDVWFHVDDLPIDPSLAPDRMRSHSDDDLIRS